MSTASGPYARVIVDVGPAHLDRLFDYRIADGQDVAVGRRVAVRFNGRRRTAWVADVVDTPGTDPDKVKPIDRVDGDLTWFDDEDLRVWRWLADRFAGTMSGAIRHALPKRIARVEAEAASWGPRRQVEAATAPPCARAVAWKPLDGAALLRAASDPAGQAFHLRVPQHTDDGDEGPAIVDLVARCVAAGRQALVLSPSEAPGPADDVIAAMGAAAVDLRRLDADADRYRAFLRLRRGDLDVAVGERSAALWPLDRLGLIVLLDEANPAYKERRNPRHHVREAVLGRARIQGATVVLTSSVLSAQAHRHVSGGHVTAIRADRATERAQRAPVTVVDRAALPVSARRTRLTAPIADEIARAVAADQAVIVLAAAKGSGSSLACSRCRSRFECRDCGSGISASADGERWACAVCDWTSRPFACFDCDATETFPLRAGASRLASELAKTFSAAEVAHMEGFDQPGPASRPSIAVMTRGSVVARPAWLRGRRAALLVIADPDVLLGRPSVDAAEDALRLWLDAARLADAVILQTGQPAHPAIQALVRADPDGFWDGETDRRRPLGFPPVGSVLRLTGLTAAAGAAIRRDVPGTLLGPGQDGVALVKTTDLPRTLAALAPLRRSWALDDVRVRIDVDPVTIG